MNAGNDTNRTFSGLPWPELIPGKLTKRYKRFLADVELEDGRTVTAHCPNSGSMKTCSEPGQTVYISYHNNPKRKLKYTWELIEMPDSLVGVNTMVPNRLVYKSIQAGKVEELTGYDNIVPEVKTSKGTRLDLLLSNRENNRCYVEIKNCTLVKDKIAFFPDAVTTRGLKHLVELQNLYATNCRSVIFYLVQRMDACLFKPAAHIDDAYARELMKAEKNGVEILVYDVVIDLEKILLGKKLPYRL
ncbi:MAG: DNA/RNA nuclease SfsA [Deltaproteobacteria bacterium]|nr:DNA/RNA nuclease SfsA [Deltaproteobacteria bacterium]MBW2218173.1 DNA/RNA nuclease SfsA [Deltaproteobacteria bacterium]